MIDTSGFDKGTREIEQMVRRNVGTYGRSLAGSFEREAKSGHPWVNRRGNAELHLFGTSTQTASTVRVDMGGVAPNYKQGPLSASDYLEYLEFGHGGRFAVILPTAEAIFEEVQASFGDAALQGRSSPRISIKRNRAELTQKRKQLLTGTAAGAFTLMEYMRYQSWLASRDAFNG